MTKEMMESMTKMMAETMLHMVMDSGPARIASLVSMIMFVQTTFVNLGWFLSFSRSNLVDMGFWPAAPFPGLWPKGGDFSG